MNSIQIELQENHGQFAARASWGMSSWHRDPMTAISELFGKALPFANHQAKAYVVPESEAPSPEPSP